MKDAVERILRGLANPLVPLAIDETYGMRKLAQFTEEVIMADIQGSYSGLGLSERRAASGPSLLIKSENSVEERPFSEINAVDGAVAVLRLSDVMRMEDGACSYGVATFIKNLREADQAPGVLGTIVEINSGGGEATAGQAAMTALATNEKPTIAVVQFAGSAAYQAALGADKIYAEGMYSEVGSIGVLVSMRKGFIEWYSRTFEDIYSDFSPQKNNVFRSLQKGDRAPLKKMLNDTAQAYQATVLAMRNGLKGGNKLIADTLEGAMFPPKQAQRRGLIDGVKSTREAVSEIISMADSGKGRLISLNHNIEEAMSLLDNLKSLFTAPDAEVDKPKLDEQNPEKKEDAPKVEEPKADTDEGKAASQEDQPKAESGDELKPLSQEERTSIAEVMVLLNEKIEAQGEQIAELRAAVTSLESEAKEKNSLIATLQGISGKAPQPGSVQDASTLQKAEADFQKKATGFRAKRKAQKTDEN